MAKSLNVIVEFKRTNESLLYHFKAKGIRHQIAFFYCTYIFLVNEKVIHVQPHFIKTTPYYFSFIDNQFKKYLIK